MTSDRRKFYRYGIAAGAFALGLGFIHKIEMGLGNYVPAWERTIIDDSLGGAVLFALFAAAVFLFLDAIASRSALRIVLYGLVLAFAVGLIVTVAYSLFTGGPPK